MAGGTVHHFQKVHVRALCGQLFPQPDAIPADAPGVADGRAGPGQGDGLVEAFAAGELAVVVAGNRLAGAHQMLHPVDVIDVNGTEVEDCHRSFPL